MISDMELEIHDVLEDDRLKATGKLEAIEEILYGPELERLEEFEDSRAEEPETDEDEDED